MCQQQSDDRMSAKLNRASLNKLFKLPDQVCLIICLTTHQPSHPLLPGKTWESRSVWKDDELRSDKQRWNKAFITGHASGGVLCSPEASVDLHWWILLRETSCSVLEAICRETKAVVSYWPVMTTVYFLVSAVQLSFRGLKKWQESNVKVHGWKDCLIRYRASYL